ncbi:hypothetical protein COMA2_10113 [Candidatus Nitrospira nitrificans]|uniref:Uncharacterized protein n=1 Tax=Candidatus Nitrospira nitrificans TaxID=1742973 RepID=A0A0S4L450_9BACT|nr:hypothetical protein COMA2_10113 [Candidatus Nitrospira nitrificans]
MATSHDAIRRGLRVGGCERARDIFGSLVVPVLGVQRAGQRSDADGVDRIVSSSKFQVLSLSQHATCNLKLL